MTHSNIINFLSGSLWLSTDEQMAVVQRVSNSILQGKNAEMREAFLNAKKEDEQLQAENPEMDAKDLDLRRGQIKIANGVAEIPVHGAIGPKFNMMSALSGGVSAELLTRNIKALTERDDIHTLLFDVDSNGGSVHGIEPAAAAIRAANDAGKRTVAIANYNMNSAAYWIGSAAQKVFVTPTSNIGSIGVLSVLRFADKDEQQRVEIIRSVPGKANVNPFEPLSEDARKKLKSDIDNIHASFTEAVSLNRNISMAKAKELANGEVEMGEAAVEAGLADAVVESKDEVLAMIEAETNLETKFESMKAAYLASEQNIRDLQAELAELDAEITAHIAEVQELEAKLEAGEKSAEMGRFESILDSAIDEGRIAAGLRDEWVEDFQSGDVSISTFERMVGNISPGTVVPQDELDTTAEASEPISADKPANDVERALFAQFPLLQEK